MKSKIAIVVFAVGALFTTAVTAEVFVGAGVINSSYDYPDLDNSTGHKIFGGYYFPNGVFVEIANVDLGDTESDLAPAGFQASGFAGYVGYRSQTPTGLGFFGKLGMYSFDTDLHNAGVTVATQSSSGLAWSLGIFYAINNNVAIRGELEQFVSVEDFVSDESITSGSVSVEFRF